MNKRNLKILAAVSVALVLVLLTMQLDNGDSAIHGGPLFPELKAEINDLNSVTVTRPGDGGTTLIVKQEENWVIASRDDYPADIGRLRELLLALAEAKTVERKTSNPELYGQLGLQDPEIEGSKGTRIELHGAVNEYRLIVGNVAQAGFRYIRIAGDSQSWLIDRNPEIPDTTGEWLSRNIVDIKAAEVRSAIISHPDGEEIRISKASRDDTDFEVENIPAGRELSYATVTSSITGVLSALTLDDVRKSADVPADAVITTFDTFDGARIVVKTQKSDDESWISLHATAIESQGTVTLEAETTQNETDDATAKTDVVDAINTRVTGWQFRIPQYKANQLTRRWDDILKAESE